MADNSFKKTNKNRELMLNIVLNRFSTLGEKTVFCVSTYTLLHEVFGTKKDNYIEDFYFAIYLLLRGESVKYISETLGIPYHKLRVELHNLYSELDVSSAHDMTAKVMLWFLQRKKILILPSDDYVISGLNRGQIKEVIT